MHGKCSHRAGPWGAWRHERRRLAGESAFSKEGDTSDWGFARQREPGWPGSKRLSELCVVEDRAGVFGCPCYPSVCM